MEIGVQHILKFFFQLNLVQHNVISVAIHHQFVYVPEKYTRITQFIVSAVFQIDLDNVIFTNAFV